MFFLAIILGIVAISGCSNNESEDIEDYPSKSIKAIVPWSSGSGSDIAFRGYAKYVADELGKDIDVTNVTGGNGGVGWAEILSKDSDGYNMALLTFDVLTNEALETSDVSYDDFDIINIFTLQGMLISTHSDYGFETIDDFLEAAKDAKENGEKLTIGTNGDYGLWHQAGVLMQEATDTEGAFEFVPFDGSGEQTTEMLGKHVDAIITSPTPIIEHVEEGSIQPLATMTDERIDAFDDIPTFTEIGYDVVYESFRTLALPKGTPDEILDKIKDASKKAFENPEFQEWAEETDIDPEYMESEEAIEYLENKYPDVQKIVEKFD